MAPANSMDFDKWDGEDAFSIFDRDKWGAAKYYNYLRDMPILTKLLLQDRDTLFASTVATEWTEYSTKGRYGRSVPYSRFTFSGPLALYRFLSKQYDSKKDGRNRAPCYFRWNTMGKRIDKVIKKHDVLLGFEDALQ